ncbi:MAG: RIP metalloprotease RseP [Bacteroidetes bacterium]|nr:RIP metalloprotease RseP [Bacteroidota bacterium]
MEILSTIFYFIITIGILVLVHELGHFVAAKLFKMRVEVFSIGFPPRAFGKKIGETDYCISWIPIGGYVKIAGMVDESFDTDFLHREPQPWEFRAKPLWQRAIVLSAGVVMNILLAILIFWGIIYSQGKIIRPVTEIGYIKAESPAEKVGLRVGDKILSINGKHVKQWNEIESELFAENLSAIVTIEVLRENQTVTVTIPQSMMPNMIDEQFGMLPVGLVPVVGMVEPGKPADQIGLVAGDTILAVNGKSVHFGELPSIVKAHAGKELILTWKHADEVKEARVVPTTEGRLGIMLEMGYVGPQIHEKYTVLEAFPISIREVVLTTKLFLTNIAQIVAGKVSFRQSVGGPVKIAQLASRSAESGALAFWGFVALLSISLALLNILPFPALDGGHLLLVLYEAIFRRPVPDKVVIVLQKVGFALLLVFMAFVLYNDIVNF